MTTTTAWARPEYAAKEKMSCVECHDSPWGGGPRTVLGKVYGTHGLEGSATTFTDIFYGDLRSIAYYPFSQTSQKTNGAAQMEAAATANVPLLRTQGEEQTPDARVVATYNISSLAGSELREGYLRYSPASSNGKRDTYWMVGHINVPFGLLTDEHRTYTRIQTNMDLDDYDTGVAYSHDFSRATHMDLAVVNDFQTGGTFNTQGVTYGVVGNLRVNPEKLPFLIGLSANYEHITVQPEPYAGSLYGVISADRLTHDAVSGSLSLESVIARNWNNPGVNANGIHPDLAGFFLPSGASIAPYLTSTSFGNTALAKYWVNPHLNLFYKFDYLALDARNLQSAFTRHGVGFEIWIIPNLSLNTRVEFARTPANLASTPDDTLAAQDDFFAMVRLWL